MSSPNTRDNPPHAEPEAEQQPTQPTPLPPAAPKGAANAGPASRQEIPADQIKSPSEVNRDDPNVNVVELPPPSSPTFKERVYGYARVVHGTVLGKPDVKEQGEQVLRGQQTIPLRRGSQSSNKD